ncbi:MAG: hypothetical protein FWD21_01940, partial [Peptococcaceae bacterium]|nr:hypothetical protein [Peptococcaceae bacterium]
MQVQATPTGNQTAAPKEFGKNHDQKGDAGAFDAAVASLLSALSNSRQKTIQQTFDQSANRNSGGKEQSAPVSDKSFEQMESLSRKVMRMAAETTHRESGNNTAAAGDSREAEASRMGLGRDHSHNREQAINHILNRIGQTAAEGALVEKPVDSKVAANTAETAPKTVIITEEQTPRTQQQNYHRHNESMFGRRVDVVMEQILVKGATEDVKVNPQTQTTMAAAEAAKAHNNALGNVKMVVELEQAA